MISQCVSNYLWEATSNYVLGIQLLDELYFWERFLEMVVSFQLNSIAHIYFQF